MLLDYDSLDVQQAVASATGLSRNAANWHAHAEATFVDLLENRQPKARGNATAKLDIDGARASLKAMFHNPEGARHLIATNRRNTTERGETTAGEVDPRETLERYIVLRYSTPQAAAAAAKNLARSKAVISAAQDIVFTLSAAPTDEYFSMPAPFGYNGYPDVTNYQWGLHAMQFQGVWDRTNGHGYVGVVDVPLWNDPYYQYPQSPWNRYQPIYFSVSNINPDLAYNFRQQFAGTSSASGGYPETDPPEGRFWNLMTAHGRHVAGIVAARSSLSLPNPGDAYGVAGACANCSLIPVATFLGGLSGGFQYDVVEAVTIAVDRGVQAINMSFNYSEPLMTCASSPNPLPFCTALAYANQRDVFVAVASGNLGGNNPGPWSFPYFPSLEPTVLGVAAMGTALGGAPSNPYAWGLAWAAREDGSISLRSNNAPDDGVVAPGMQILSTYQPWQAYDKDIGCGDYREDVHSWNFDRSTPRYEGHYVYGDGVGTCTGSSMAAPHVTALAGLLRSAKPLANYQTIRQNIRNSSYNPGVTGFGYGLPNATSALNLTIGSPASATNRLTPLFAMYSSAREDSFYTSVPQMAATAKAGTLEPRYVGASGSYATNRGVTVAGYNSFPGIYGSATAEAWLFTTPENPKTGNTKSLVPLYRMSYACSHQLYTIVHARCGPSPGHTDTAYATSTAGINALATLGYRLDGIEGYVYPMALTQPPGTQRLIQRYHPGRDDHAIFPENLLAQYQLEGYTQVSGVEALGYVYANQGQTPTIQ